MATSPRPVARWAVPAGLAAAAVGATLIAPTIAAAEPDLPDVTAAELLADLRTEPVDGLSGTVVHRAALGLPSLPGLTDGGGGPVGESADAFSLLDGEHTLRVWAAAPDRARVSLHGGMSEMTVVSDGDETWVWQSEGAQATRFLLPDGPSPDDPSPDEAAALRDKARAGLPPMTPDEYADLLLAELDPTTEVTVGDPVTVAGRAAYQLVLDPRTDGTLIDEVRIAVDAADRVPTRVQVLAVGHTTPAIDVGFTELSLVAPDDDVFAFTPPPGAEVETVDLTEKALTEKAEKAQRRLTHEDLGEPGEGGELDDSVVPDDGVAADGERPVTVVGDGWESVLVAALPADALGHLAGEQPADDAAPAPAPEDAEALRPGPPRGDDEAPSVAGVLEALPRVDGDWGSGRLLESRLFSVLLTDDGRVLVGAVDGEALQAAAAATPVPAVPES